MDPAPFNSPDAELVLHTSDGISLRVYSRILAQASPFFYDLLTLPQPASTDATSAPLDVSENSKVMHTLLMFIYPIEDPHVEALSLLGDVLAAALKYDMSLATQSLRRLLVSPQFLQHESLRVYAIACRHHLEEEAKLASTHTLSTNILEAPLAEELKFITAYDYHRLLNLHRIRGIEAKKLLVHQPHVRCQQCSGGQLVPANPPRWWVEFSNRAGKELQRKPTTNAIFSLPFLAQAARGGCQRCGTSILDSHEFLAALKKSIDDLPATI